MNQDGVSEGTPACVFTLYKFRQVFATRDTCARITRRRGSEDVHTCMLHRIHPVSVAYDGHSDVLTQFLPECRCMG
ncbi:hypothetical protein BE221DRAFT_64947 [Ostreococcus tauri]|uniref:Uncharacterized protein n=1 Tax=Ostreococcus tauri TaxID=70448 RepID=A0A1Y5HWQ7_OSTTA|nr:hypothetical protein BE221DRAFT_64947 [Ostreococcus tauri]